MTDTVGSAAGVGIGAGVNGGSCVGGGVGPGPCVDSGLGANVEVCAQIEGVAGVGSGLAACSAVGWGVAAGSGLARSISAGATAGTDTGTCGWFDGADGSVGTISNGSVAGVRLFPPIGSERGVGGGGKALWTGPR